MQGLKRYFYYAVCGPGRRERTGCENKQSKITKKPALFYPPGLALAFRNDVPVGSQLAGRLPLMGFSPRKRKLREAQSFAASAAVDEAIRSFSRLIIALRGSTIVLC